MDHNHFNKLLFPQPKEALHKIWATLAQRLQRRSRLKFSTCFPYKCKVPIHMHREANDLAVKGQTSIYDHNFSNFGRPPVPDDLRKDAAPRRPRFWRRRFLKSFYHIWAWRPSWSVDRDHFSNLSFPQPEEAPHEIWATLAQRFRGEEVWNSQHFSHRNVWYPYNCIGKQTRSRRKKVKRQCTTIILATLVDLSSSMICAKIQPKASSVLEKNFFKRFYKIWAGRPSWSTDRDHFSNFFCSPNLRRLHMKLEQNWLSGSEEE